MDSKMKPYQKVARAKRLMRLIVAAAAIVMAALLIRGMDFGGPERLSVTFYNLKSSKINGNGPVRVVFLTDLHLREFGEENSVLLEKVKKLAPDIIAVGGDITTKDESDHHVAIQLLNDLGDIAPVYYGYGNHEYSEILFDSDSTLRQELADTKAVLANKNCHIIDIRGTKIAIGGLCVGEENFDQSFREYLDEFCEQECLKILISHHTELFEECMEGYPVDLALTGHAHGGQVRLPVLGGLYSPDQGLLPKLTEGIHDLCGSHVVISRGLGGSSWMPRIFNDPEIVVVDISRY